MPRTAVAAINKDLLKVYMQNLGQALPCPAPPSPTLPPQAGTVPAWRPGALGRGSGGPGAALTPGRRPVNSRHSMAPHAPRHASAARFMAPLGGPMLTFLIRVALFLLMLIVASVAAFLLSGSAGGAASSPSMAVFTNIDATDRLDPRPGPLPHPQALQAAHTLIHAEQNSEHGD